MARGGAREGSGPKHKWVDSDGNPLPTKSMRIPETITKQDIQKILEEKEKQKDKPS